MKMPKTLIIGVNTFKEIYKSKIMLNLFFIGVGLMAITYMISSFSYGVPHKIALDIGLGAMSLSGVGIAIFMGHKLLASEIENRTIYLILARPISRTQFLLGRILGMAGILLLNCLVIGALILGLFLTMGGAFDSTILWSMLYIYCEVMLILQVVVFFSLITNTTLTIMFSIIIYFLGHAVDNIIEGGVKLYGNAVVTLAHIYSFVFPNFSKLNIKKYLLYDHQLDISYLGSHFLYAVCYILGMAIVCTLLLHKKNLD